MGRTRQIEGENGRFGSAVVALATRSVVALATRSAVALATFDGSRGIYATDHGEGRWLTRRVSDA